MSSEKGFQPRFSVPSLTCIIANPTGPACVWKALQLVLRTARWLLHQHEVWGHQEEMGYVSEKGLCIQVCQHFHGLLCIAECLLTWPPSIHCTCSLLCAHLQNPMEAFSPHLPMCRRQWYSG